MSDYLTRDWPLGETSTVYMSGKSVYSVRRYGKPGVITTVELFAADAQTIRDHVREALIDAWDEGLDSGSRGGDPSNNPYREATP